MTHSPTGLIRMWEAGCFTGSGTKGLPREKAGERGIRTASGRSVPSGAT